MGDCYIVRRGGGGGGLNKFPEFTYTGTYELIDDGLTEDKVQNWRIKFLTSGKLIFEKSKVEQMDIFVVGGGGGGGRGKSTTTGGGGGGGGYTKASKGHNILLKTEYSITVGAGGSGASASTGIGTTGGQSGVVVNSSTLISASGGIGGGGYNHSNEGKGGNGGSGGGSGQRSGGTSGYGGFGGSDGENGGAGYSNSNNAGTGQGTSTREFWDIDQNASATLYAGGGSGGGYIARNGGDGGGGTGGPTPSAGETNSGGGGGGGTNSTGGAGGSGIVIIRNNRSGQKPVPFVKDGVLQANFSKQQSINAIVQQDGYVAFQAGDNGIGIFTVPCDLTNCNTLSITVDDGKSYYRESKCPVLCVGKNRPTCTSETSSSYITNIDRCTSMSNVEGNFSGTFTLDVSDLSGWYYVGLTVVSITGANYYANVTEFKAY